MRKANCTLAAGLVLALGLGSVVRAQTDSEFSASEEAAVGMKEMTVAQVLVVLNREAREAVFRDDGASKANFAQRKGWSLPQGELLRILSRRQLNSDRGMEGYIKWQLLSFEPPLEELDTDTLRKLVEAMPALKKQPAPALPDPPAQGLSLGATQRTGVTSPGTSGGRPRVTTTSINSGGSLGIESASSAEARYVKMITEANQGLRKAQQSVKKENHFILAYRDELLPRLPHTDGMRLAGMMYDISERIAAGDPSTDKAINRLVSECKRLKPDTLPPATRQNLLREAEKFENHRTVVIENIRAHRERAGEGSRQRQTVSVEHKSSVVRFPPDKLAIVLEAIRGEQSPR